MGVKLREIEGLVKESDECYCGVRLEAGLCPYGHNPPYTLQGSVEITMDEENLTKMIFQYMSDSMIKHNERFVVNFSAQDLADAIIKDLKLLLVVEKGKT